MRFKSYFIELSSRLRQSIVESRFCERVGANLIRLFKSQKSSFPEMSKKICEEILSFKTPVCHEDEESTDILSQLYRAFHVFS